MAKRVVKKAKPAKRSAAKRARAKVVRPRKRIRDITPPVAEHAVIDGVTANTDYELDEHIHGDLATNTIALYRGSTRVAGDLALDFDGDDDSPDGTIVDGDLEVAGSIVNRSGDSGPFLLVTGNLRAKNLIAGGAEIVVLGDLIVDDVIFGFYNHGSVTVHGTTRAKAIISEYHAFDLRGRVEGITVSGRGRVTHDDHFRSYAPALVADVLTDGNPPGGYPDSELTTEAILAGRRVLREDVVLN